jgi:hypothetical protein
MHGDGEAMNTNTLEQTILWRRLDVPGHDACGLWVSDNGWCLAGTAMFLFEEQPCHLRYEVDCDSAWRTRAASVSGWLGRTPVQLTLETVPGERWTLNGAEQGEEVAGLVDVDLGFTPATNLIQLRRLALDVGHEVEAPVVYLHFPELTLGRLEHRYHRVALDKYDYQAPAFDYAAILQVSELGFVTQYPGLWALEALQ